MKKINPFSQEFLKALRETDFNKMSLEEIEEFDKKYDQDLEKALELDVEERETLSSREWKEALITIKHHL